MEKLYKVLGFNDDVCECDVCGKVELKGTYALEEVGTGDVIRAGSVCGATMAGWSKREWAKKVKESERLTMEAAIAELKESDEYLQHKLELERLNRERDRLIDHDTSRWIPQHERQAKEAQVKGPKERMAHMLPYTLKLQAKEAEIKAKYKLSTINY